MAKTIIENNNMTPYGSEDFFEPGETLEADEMNFIAQNINYIIDALTWVDIPHKAE